MLRVAGLRISPLARIGVGAGLALAGYAFSAPVIMLVGGGLAASGIVGSVAPKHPDGSEPG